MAKQMKLIRLEMIWKSGYRSGILKESINRPFGSPGLNQLVRIRIGRMLRRVPRPTRFHVVMVLKGSTGQTLVRTIVPRTEVS